jgi:hypothetical protein
MEAYETPRAPTPSLRLRVLERPQRHLTKQRLLLKPKTQDAPVLQEAPKRTAKAKAKACARQRDVRGDHVSRTSTSRPSRQLGRAKMQRKSPTGGVCWNGLLIIEDDQRRRRIIVPSEQRERLVKQEHLSLFHVFLSRQFNIVISRPPCKPRTIRCIKCKGATQKSSYCIALTPKEVKSMWSQPLLSPLSPGMLTRCRVHFSSTS